MRVTLITLNRAIPFCDNQSISRILHHSLCFQIICSLVYIAIVCCLIIIGAVHKS